MSFYSFSNLTSVTTIVRHLKLFYCILMFVNMYVLCLFTEGLREDWLYQLSHPPKIKYLLTYLLILSSLPISVLRILDTEANKFYDRNHQLYDAALLTRCYTQHALRPFIDSETNHKRHFIKIPYDLPSILKNRSVISSIPTYFQNSEPPIICYKYSKPIRSTVFNFNKLVSDLDIHANTPES